MAKKLIDKVARYVSLKCHDETLPRQTLFHPKFGTFLPKRFCHQKTNELSIVLQVADLKDDL